MQQQKTLLCLLGAAGLVLCQDTPVFTAEANLQSITVQITDRAGHDIRGLSPSDFTLLEDGRPQKISFFGAEEQPVSLAVLVDSSASMRSGHKLERVAETLPPLLQGSLPGDEIYFAQFTDKVFPLQPLTGEQRLHPPLRRMDSAAGTSFYDALATALCTLRGARNLRQAVVVITDGADQHSRLSLQQLIRIAQASRPQIFVIGYFDDREALIFRGSGNVVTLVNSHDIDNPVKAFKRISAETGAESFFPTNHSDLEKALARILGILHAQYTLAYHTERPNAFRRIQVKVNRPGAIVSSRRAVGSETEDGGAVHFSVDSCTVSPTEHPYPWEPHATTSPDGLITYRDDLTDPHSGWPVHPGLRYTEGAYEIAPFRARDGTTANMTVANGPALTDFYESVDIELQRGNAGLAFRLNEAGTYMLLLQKSLGSSVKFTLVKKYWNGGLQQTILAWTNLPGSKDARIKVGVECSGDKITLRIEGQPDLSLKDDSFSLGQAGLAFSGLGRALFRDFKVQELK